MNLLVDTLKKNERYQNIEVINSELLFRASEYGYNSDAFHDCCDNKWPAVIVIDNEYRSFL